MRNLTHTVKTWLTLVLPLVAALTLPILAQQSGGGGTGGSGAALLTTANTWDLLQTYTVGTKAPVYNFTAGSKLTEISDGVVKLTNSTAAAGATFQIGGANGGTNPQLVSAASTLTLQRADGGGARLAWAGAVPSSGNCSAGEVFASSPGIIYVCNQFNNFIATGATALASAAVAGSGPALTPSVVSGGYRAFRLDVGTGGTATDASFTLPTAQGGWNCHAENITANAANRANQRVMLTSSSTSGATLQNQTVSTGAAVAFTASDSLAVTCVAY